MNFNSFSKIDISYLNFLHNNFRLNHSLILDKQKNSIELSIEYLIKITGIKLDNITNNIIPINSDTIIAVQKSKQNILNLKTINLNSLKTNTNLEYNLFQLFTSIHIIDYISNILVLISRIVNKLSIIFFDKYIFANGLEHDLNQVNEPIYKELLNTELKRLMYQGNQSLHLKNLFKKDLFESRNIIKLDENIHFNFKNVEDILVENIKPCINTLMFYLNEIKYNFNVISNSRELDIIIEHVELLNNIFNNYLIEIVNTKNGYRNFLAFLNSYNTLAKAPEALKAALTNYVFNFDRLFEFVNQEGYRMKSLIDVIDTGNINTTLNTNNDENKKPELNILKNQNLMYTLEQAGLIDTVNDFYQKVLNSNVDINRNQVNNIGAKSVLNELKMGLTNYYKNLNEILSNKIQINDYLEFPDINYDSITKSKIKIIGNDSRILLTFEVQTNTNNLLVIKIIDDKIFALKLQFNYEQLKILDYDIHNYTDLVLFVKSSNSKNSAIVSKLENYQFNEIKDTNVEFNNISSEAIKIDKFLDLEVSENSLIDSGDRKLIGIIDNSKNKLVILDLTNN